MPDQNDRDPPNVAERRVSPFRAWSARLFSAIEYQSTLGCVVIAFVVLVITAPLLLLLFPEIYWLVSRILSLF